MSAGAPAIASQKRIVITSRRVRIACLETVQGEMPVQQMVPVQPWLLQQQEQKDIDLQSGVDISIKGFSIHVTESTSMPLLSEVLKVVQHAQWRHMF